MHCRILHGALPAIERIEGRYTVIERLSKKKNMEQIFIRSTGRTLQQLCGPFCSKVLPAMKRVGPLIDDLMTAKVAFTMR